ncbi:MAG TPA: sarcosine oxidase subunit gamma [Candidatus Yaniella excrementigallinarum]|nr:sarcosine oxidase subunit gamma [Candidatus Yaniella excrementigallinarum]
MANLQELRRSPLAGRTQDMKQASGQNLSIREVPFTTQVGLRAEPGTAGHAALAAKLGGLPEKVGDVVGDVNSTAVLWLSPDEFLAVDAPDTGLTDELAQALGDESGQVLDLSANRTFIEISGPAAELVLRKSCPLDLHPRTWKINQAYVTEVAQTPVILWKIGDFSWRIAPRISFADHVVNWLLDAMIEFSHSEV